MVGGRPVEKIKVFFPRAIDVQVKSPIMESIDDIKQPTGDVETSIAWHAG